MALDFQIWDQLLGRYVNDQGRVDYAAWKVEQVPKLNAWIQAMEQVSLSADPDTQIAFWINIYNALTIRQILEQYPISSIRPNILGIPNWVAFLRFFERKVFTLGETQYSLNQIEHGVLRGQLQQYKIHFALVCASIGCPLLRNQAYQPDQIQDQLEKDTHRFINNPDKVKFDSKSRILYCSKIFKWYRQDFLKVSPSIQDFVAKHLDQNFPSLNPSTPVQYLPYDWSLNQRTFS